jgi:hypothetical protein
MATKPNLLVLASPDSPELTVLDKIKDDVNIVGVGITLAQLQNVQSNTWPTIEMVLAAGASSLHHSTHAHCRSSLSTAVV